MKKKIIFTFLVLLIATLLSQAQGLEVRSITIGGLFNTTGFASFAGEASRDGFILAIEDAEKSGIKVNSAVEDSQSSLQSAVSGAKKLTAIDKVIAVVGPEWTEFGQVVSSVAETAKTPFFSPWVVAEAPYIKKPYFWSMTPSDKSEHVALIKYLISNNIKSVSLIYSNNFWSETNIDMFKNEASKNGIIIASEDKQIQEDNDFRTVVKNINNKGGEVIYSAIATDEGHSSLLRQIKELGVQKKVLTHSARGLSPILKNRYPNLLDMQIFAIPQKSILTKEFEEKYKTRFKKEVQAPSAAASYDAATLIIKAIKSGVKNTDELVKYIEHLTPYQGYSGLISFDKDGKLPDTDSVVSMYNKNGDLIGIK